jgi:hypothetical protein
MVIRRAKLQGQRGAAVFIVVMVLTLLTAVGIFAVRSASLADVAAGYDRDAAQASLVAQYATTTAATYLATPAGAVIMSNIKPNLYCQANMGIQAPCFKLTSTMLEASTVLQGNETLFEPVASSSLNANGSAVADFMIELTDPARSGQLTAGDPHSPVQVTVTAIAQIQQAGACVNGVGTTSNAGQQMMRALISAGNL